MEQPKSIIEEMIKEFQEAVKGMKAQLETEMPKRKQAIENELESLKVIEAKVNIRIAQMESWIYELEKFQKKKSKKTKLVDVIEDGRDYQ
jgi:flagellar motility protein MotE (MotC chaperone)